MRLVKSLVFRKLTDADFFNINKPPGIETDGGGQSYIDFPTSKVTLSNWNAFLQGITSTQLTQGPSWQVPIRSLGTTGGVQNVKIYQRRTNSVSIASQKLHSRESNRVYSWRPNLTEFPQPDDPSVRGHIRHLHIFIAKLDNGEYWAGWFQASKPDPYWSVNTKLNRMFSEDSGYIEFDEEVLFDKTDSIWAFRVIPGTDATPTVSDFFEPEIETEENNIQKSQFNEDEEVANGASPITKKMMRNVRARNTKAVKKLKELYNNKCQISGEEFIFKKRDGTLYSEAHHLIHLGKGGADSVRNIVIVGPLIHRMLHYAKVEGLDLKNIKGDKLTIKINEKDYTITWHPDHAEIINKFN